MGSIHENDNDDEQGGEVSLPGSSAGEGGNGSTSDKQSNSGDDAVREEDAGDKSNGDEGHNGSNSHDTKHAADGEGDGSHINHGNSHGSGMASLSHAQAMVQSHAPLQPYAYPPYPYYPPHMGGYMPPPGMQPPPIAAGAHSPEYLMTGHSNPYEYRDASGHSDPPPDEQRNRGGVTEPFPQKLHRMLEASEREGTTDVVSFFSHGRAFAIHKPRRFVSEIMNRFFRQSKLTSFQRQLNLYGFRRISQGPDNGGYYHELFLKGRPGLCINMKRTKVKGNQKIKRDPDTEPNFYAYPQIKAVGVFPGPTASPPIQGQPPSPYSAGAANYPYAPMYPSYANGPYTAAQQNQVGGGPPPSPVGYGGYPYPPYGYPWYPPHHGGGQPPSPAGAAPQTSPIRVDAKKSGEHSASTATRKPENGQGQGGSSMGSSYHNHMAAENNS